MSYHEDRQRVGLQLFYKELCFRYNGNYNKSSQGIASTEHIADTLHMNVYDVQRIMDQLVSYGITEKQGGGYVI